MSDAPAPVPSTLSPADAGAILSLLTMSQIAFGQAADALRLRDLLLRIAQGKDIVVMAPQPASEARAE